MVSFVNAIRSETNATATENGMAALKSSTNANVDLFFSIAASRGKDITGQFDRALAEDRDMALRCLLWARDARGGAGERETFRSLLKHIEANYPHLLDAVLPLVPELGRWDDLLVLRSEKAGSMIAAALKAGDNLCAKWMPRKGAEAAALRDFLGMTPKQYRKTLVGLSNTVEQRMCAKQWHEIDFGKLPSLAAARYQKAFLRNAAERYNAYKAALVKGEAKVNASVAYPYDVTRALVNGDQTVATAQWEALPNYMSDEAKILPLVDTSGSMSGAVASGSLSAMDVAVSLGLYIATKQKGAFAGAYLTFESKPSLEVLKPGTLKQKYAQMYGSSWGGSTNIEAAYAKILEVARACGVPQEEMPDYLLIFSDMQFNQAVTDSRDTAYTLARNKFEAAGYKLPKLIFWNLADRGGNTPVKHDQNGTALVSGFSPSLMTSILGAKTVTPEGIMRETLMKPRYAPLG
jgi:hypothetical protein